MFTKAKYGEYQITPNLMHAHAMHLRQSYYETRHYNSTKLEELHYRVKHLSCRILRYCVTRERIYGKRSDSHALAELGAKTPINQLFEELQDIHEEYEAEYKRLNIADPPITPLGIPNNLTGEGVEEAVAVMENLARQGVNLHWQAVRFASTCRMLEAHKWLEEFIRTHHPNLAPPTHSRTQRQENPLETNQNPTAPHKGQTPTKEIPQKPRQRRTLRRHQQILTEQDTHTTPTYTSFSVI